MENTKQFEFNFIVRNKTQSLKNKELPYQHTATLPLRAISQKKTLKYEPNLGFIQLISTVS